MKYLKIKKQLILLAATIFIFSACKKTEIAKPLGDAGQTIIKIIGGSSPAAVQKNSVAFSAVPQKLLLVQLRRDVPSETELNKAMTVTVKDDLAAVTAANPAYVQFPPAWYTVETDGVKTGGQGGTYTFTFKPGEFAKEIYINIPNATVMNPGAKYGLGFSITTVDGGGKISSQQSVVNEIVTNNAWDGVYRDDFCNYHPTLNTGYTCSTTVIHLITTGVNRVQMFWPVANAFGNPAILGGNLTYFGGAQEPELVINMVNNAVVVYNACQSCNTGFYEMAVNWPNNYDPATGTFNLRWGYSYAVSGVFDPDCREWTQTLTYLGPR